MSNNFRWIEHSHSARLFHRSSATGDGRRPATPFDCVVHWFSIGIAVAAHLRAFIFRSFIAFPRASNHPHSA